jgi:hypothetical protein
MVTINYAKSLDIRNVECLPLGLNAPYLEVMTSHIPDVYIAVAWHRKSVNIPSDHIMVIF